MFLFRILFLPLTLLGMALGLLGISSRILLLPLKIIARNTKLFLIILVVVIAYFVINHNQNKLNEVEATLKQDQQSKALPKGQLPVIEKATKFEDGNSAFATDVYRTMTDDERVQYSSVYYAVMSNVADGKDWVWSYYNINGVITPTVTFRNPSGEICRKFKETLKVHKVQQTLDGIACDNGGGSWCKLKVNATPACGLGGHSGGLFDGLSLGGIVKGIF